VAKIFVRERRHVGKGAGRPRFAVVAVQAEHLSFQRTFLRRAELEKIATELDVEIVYLPQGERAEDVAKGGRGRRRRRSKSEE
jgi:hypothetical protein